jgi:hypothetical protein
MGILENFENAWDIDFQFESNPIVETNNMGEPIVESSEFEKLLNF